MQSPVKREPDFEQFLKVLKRTGQPSHLPLYEHIASSGFIARFTETDFDKWPVDHPDYWRVYTEFWLGLGFDCVPIELPLNCALEHHEQTAGKVSHGSEATVTLRNLEELEAYPWPSTEAPIDFRPYEIVASYLPDGARLAAGVCAGPYEWATNFAGVQGLAIALYSDPDFVTALFGKLRELHTAAVRHLATLDHVAVLRQGDDLGFKTSTFLSPDDLRTHVLPIYREMASIAHDAGKPFILHSCGNLGAIYEDLITDCRIDAKHSFEDVILPVTAFKKQYGDRITPLGGLDVDRICRSSEPELRKYVREVAEVCFADGYWAFGTGNSLTDYLPVENYLICVDESLRIA